MASVKEIRERMQELYLYDLYGFRAENKVLASLLYPLEKINSIAVGLHEGRKKMVVVTYYRLIIIHAPIGREAEIEIFNREEITNASYNKRFFSSSILFEAKGRGYEFTMVSRRVVELFVWAVEQPAPLRE